MASDEYKLNNGNLLMWYDNPDGIGRTYYVQRNPTEEKILVWNTAVLSPTVLQAAVATEAHLQCIQQESDHE